MATNELPTKVQRLLNIAAKYNELSVSEDEGCASTRCWSISTDRPHSEHDRIWIYWTPAANGGSVSIRRYYGGSSKSQKVTQSQAYIWIAMLAGH